MENYVKLSKVVEKLNLKNLTPDVDMTEKKVMVPDINRPRSSLLVSLNILHMNGYS